VFTSSNHEQPHPNIKDQPHLTPLLRGEGIEEKNVLNNTNPILEEREQVYDVNNDELKALVFDSQYDPYR
jgi:hypothetical protein